jgi:hypothetical protein
MGISKGRFYDPAILIVCGRVWSPLLRPDVPSAVIAGLDPAIHA